MWKPEITQKYPPRWDSVVGFRNNDSFPAGARDFSYIKGIQTASGGHPASWSTSTGVSFPESKVARL